MKYGAPAAIFDFAPFEINRAQGKQLFYLKSSSVRVTKTDPYCKDDGLKRAGTRIGRGY